MKHEKAIALVAEICPGRAGMLWNTSLHLCCDTAQAVADQYGDDEEWLAIAALETLADGTIPEDWDETGH